MEIDRVENRKSDPSHWSVNLLDDTTIDRLGETVERMVFQVQDQSFWSVDPMSISAKLLAFEKNQSSHWSVD